MEKTCPRPVENPFAPSAYALLAAGLAAGWLTAVWLDVRAGLLPVALVLGFTQIGTV